MSFSRRWRLFNNRKKNQTDSPTNIIPSQYGSIDSVDKVDETLIEIPTDEPSLDQTDEVTIEIVTDENATINDEITAWQVVTSLATIVFARENMPRIMAATVLTAINTALIYAAPSLLGKLFSSSENKNIIGYPVDTMTLTFLLIGAGMLIQYLPNRRDAILAPVSSNNMRQILHRLIEHQLNRSLDYHSTTPFGDQVYLTQKGFSSAETGVPLLTQVIPAIFDISMAVGGLSLRFGYEMGASIIANATLTIAYTWLTTSAIIKTRDDQRKKGNTSWEKITSVLKQYKNIHDFGKYDYEIEEIRQSINTYVEAEIKAVTTSLNVAQGHIAIPRLGMLIACVYVAKGIATNQYTLEDFTLIFTYLDKLSQLIPSVGSALNNLFATWPDLKFVFHELARPSETMDPHPHVPLVTNGKAATIRFANVSFGYPNKPPIFKNLSFTIESGKTAAFVSQSGGGKSTIFKLLFRYNKPSEGKIFIEDQDIATVSLKSLRQQVGLIAQSPNLFNGTVRENILYGSPTPEKITDADIWALAENANLTEFLKSLDRGYHLELTSEKPSSIKTESQIFIYLENTVPRYALKLPESTEYPHGALLRGCIKGAEANSKPLADKFLACLEEYPFPLIEKEMKDQLLDLLLERNRITEKRLDNSVGEDGKALSGGEQQRVAILRGLMKDSVIRPLDETTSALDALTADKVMTGIHGLTLGQTKLIITHKLTEAQFADTIIVINKGKVIAQDTHDKLLEICPLYKTLWDKQNQQAANKAETTELKQDATLAANQSTISVTAPASTGEQQEEKIEKTTVSRLSKK